MLFAKFALVHLSLQVNAELILRLIAGVTDQSHPAQGDAFSSRRGGCHQTRPDTQLSSDIPRGL
jgi:hypothetical protein